MTQDQKIEHQGVVLSLMYEDERYPMLVIDTGDGVLGYTLNLSTGELNRVCICNAHSDNECICGAWNEYTD